MRILIALVMLALPAGAYAQLMKCVAKDGKVEYARDCPPGTTGQPTNIRSGPGGTSAGAAPPPPSMAERDAAFKKRMSEQQEVQQKAAKQAADAGQKREACEQAQLYLKTVESGLRLTRTDPKTGERVYLEDSEREAEAANARARVAKTCGS